MSDENTQPTGETPVVDFGKWLEGQTEDVKSLLDGHTKGLKAALDSERDTRKSLEKQVRDLAKQAESGSAAQKQLTEMADQIQASERRQMFYDEAHSQGITNLKLGYLAAQDAGLIDAQGRVNWKLMKESFPQLFSAVTLPRGNAGAGTQSPVSGTASMNDFIRAAAGKK